MRFLHLRSWANSKSFLAGRRQRIIDVDPGHACQRRPAPQPFDHCIDGLDGSLGLDLDITVAQITHPASDTETPRLLRGGGTKADALHVAADDRTDAFHGWMRSCGTGRSTGAAPP